MPGIFISYSREDEQQALLLEKALTTHGVNVFRDRVSIYAGEFWPKAIGKGISQQNIFLLLWSKNSHHSHFVEFEWNTAIALKKTIVPIFLDNTPLPEALRAKNGLIFENIDETVLKIRSLSDTAPTETDQEHNRRVLESLNDIKGKDIDAALRRVSAIYNQQGWQIEGNVYQAPGGVINVYNGPITIPNEQIENIIGKLSDEIAKRKPESDKDQPVDFSYYIKEWADKFGFTPEEVKSQLDQWAIAVKGSEDYRTLGLRQFYLKNFNEAAKNFEKAAVQGEERRKGLKEKFRKADIETYENWKDAGNALSAGYNFREALENYLKAEKIADVESYPKQWGEIKILIGNTYGNLGTRVGGEESREFISLAVLSFCKALEVQSREQLPQDWAMTQNNLGNVLKEQGIRTSVEAGALLLAQAVEAYRKALEIVTREQLPQYWAITQNNLGTALKEQGVRTSREAGALLLAQAVEAYRKALEVWTKEQLPQDWAMTQNNLGNALREQGVRTSEEAGALLLARAVDAYRKALEVRTREQLPQDWAMTQNNLGIVLRSQGIRTSGEAGALLLAQAVDAFRKALEVRTREQLPQDWAMTQNNLGNALKNQGTRTSGEAGALLLAQAIEAYRKAMEVRTKEQLPQYWAMTQNNLGAALQEQGIRTSGEAGALLLTQAVEAYRKALQVRTFEYLPVDWAQTQENLAGLYEYQQNWPAAIEHYLNAYKVNPDSAAERLAVIYHDKVFQFDKALEMNRCLANREGDTKNQPLFGFIENLFTVGLFNESLQTIEAFKSILKDSSSSKDLALVHAFEIADWICLDNPNKERKILNTLMELLKQQPEAFTLPKDFPGAKYFIENNKNLEHHRQWLLAFFTALEKDNRDGIITGLDALTK